MLLPWNPSSSWNSCQTMPHHIQFHWLRLTLGENITVWSTNREEEFRRNEDLNNARAHKLECQYILAISSSSSFRAHLERRNFTRKNTNIEKISCISNRVALPFCEKDGKVITITSCSTLSFIFYITKKMRNFPSIFETYPICGETEPALISRYQWRWCACMTRYVESHECCTTSLKFLAPKAKVAREIQSPESSPLFVILVDVQVSASVFSPLVKNGRRWAIKMVRFLQGFQMMMMGPSFVFSPLLRRLERKKGKQEGTKMMDASLWAAIPHLLFLSQFFESEKNKVYSVCFSIVATKPA